MFICFWPSHIYYAVLDVDGCHCKLIQRLWSQKCANINIITSHQLCFLARVFLQHTISVSKKRRNIFCKVASWHTCSQKGIDFSFEVSDMKSPIWVFHYGICYFAWFTSVTDCLDTIRAHIFPMSLILAWQSISESSLYSGHVLWQQNSKCAFQNLSSNTTPNNLPVV